MIATVIVVVDEVADRLFERAWQVVVFEQDAVLERLVPPLDLALGLRMVGRSADVVHTLFTQPLRQVARDVTAAVVAEQSGLV